MPIHTAIWKVAPQPQPLAESSLAKEQLLEDMIVAAPRLLSDEWMLIGRQEVTGFGGRIDLLAIAPDGSLVLIELKRDRTPREVVAQALDYAVWLEKLRPDEIVAIYGRFAPNHSLADDFQQRFGQALDEETLNESHQIIILAASLDESTERIVGYLNQRDISINVLCFQVFTDGAQQFLSRAWLLDPVRTQVIASSAPDGPNEPWNNEFYVSFGQSPTRDWADAVRYNFVCGGGGPWYSRTLRQLNLGDRIWVNAIGDGYVGVGRVTGPIQSALEFKVQTPNGEVPFLKADRIGSYHIDRADDPEACEYFVPVQWMQTVPLAEAFHEIGLFGNQNTVCKPTSAKWRSTVERLKVKFPEFDKPLLALELKS